eukprot:TRINITY_DN10987_c0_g1_i1.p1 TRINITY_DN10987_c0_g1~~TRINITY_DN10987_c0_g1_i1.p1  ORF type:complete len:365 (+),score=71.83 TRINITY_DN10987_c0_g1_i1:172-1266(+)
MQCLRFLLVVCVLVPTLIQLSVVTGMSIDPTKSAGSEGTLYIAVQYYESELPITTFNLATLDLSTGDYTKILATFEKEMDFNVMYADTTNGRLFVLATANDQPNGIGQMYIYTQSDGSFKKTSGMLGTQNAYLSSFSYCATQDIAYGLFQFEEGVRITIASIDLDSGSIAKNLTTIELDIRVKGVKPSPSEFSPRVFTDIDQENQIMYVGYTGNIQTWSVTSGLLALDLVTMKWTNITRYESIELLSLNYNPNTELIHSFTSFDIEKGHVPSGYPTTNYGTISPSNGTFTSISNVTVHQELADLDYYHDGGVIVVPTADWQTLIGQNFLDIWTTDVASGNLTQGAPVYINTNSQYDSIEGIAVL